jgi:uncharacterized protein (DUF1778 family)
MPQGRRLEESDIIATVEGDGGRVKLTVAESRAVLNALDSPLVRRTRAVKSAREKFQEALDGPRG